MKKHLFSFKTLVNSRLFLVLFISFMAISPSLRAEDLPIISANGFSCSKSNNIVSCTGSFPPHPEIIFNAGGFFWVSMNVFLPPYRYVYESDTGCLCKITYDKNGSPISKECKSALGKSQTFKLPDESTASAAWCKSN